MSYSTQAVLAKDTAVLLRAAACAATQDVGNPEVWSLQHMWELSAQPGWDAAYSYAIDTGVQNPGNAGDVINDGMILAAVQGILADETPGH